MNVSFDVDTHGPLFDGRATAAISAYLDASEQEIGQYGTNVIRNNLGTVLKHPTGHYQSRIMTDRVEGNSVISDDKVIYGPWLEGVGSRNKTTRFKGYATFRRMTIVIQNNAVTVAEKILPEYLRRMS